MIAGNHNKFRTDADDVWGTSSVPRISSCRSYPKTQALAAVPEGTTIGPVLDVHNVEILNKYGIEIASPSVADPMNKSYVVITRETDRLVHEIHDHKQELRSSNELLADLQESGRSEVCEERKATKNFKETWASPSTKEACASPLSLTPRKAPLFTKRTIPASEKKWKVIHAHSQDEGLHMKEHKISAIKRVLRGS